MSVNENVQRGAKAGCFDCLELVGETIDWSALCDCGHRLDQHGTHMGPCCRCDCIDPKVSKARVLAELKDPLCTGTLVHDHFIRCPVHD